jgi:hypothetical protein
MILLSMDKETKTFTLQKAGETIKATPEEFASGFFNIKDEVVSCDDKNDMLSVLAKAGLGYADALRDTPVVQMSRLIEMFGKPEEIEGNHAECLASRWKFLAEDVKVARDHFGGMPLASLLYPTSFFTQALKSMGVSPLRNDRDWWLESGLWKVDGPMGEYRQNTSEGNDKFEPFQIKGGFKLDRRKEERFKDSLLAVFDLKNAGPSHIIEWNISPETKSLENLGTPSPLNGIWWRKDKEGALPSICSRLIRIRDNINENCGASLFAKKMLAAAIGVFGNRDCSLYDVDIARSCTRALRNTVRKLGVAVENSGRLETSWIYADNDSVGFSAGSEQEAGELAELVELELRRISPRLQIKPESLEPCRKQG